MHLSEEHYQQVGPSSSPPGRGPTLPPIRSLFADQNLFREDVTPSALHVDHDMSHEANRADIGAAIRQFDFAPINGEQMQSHMQQMRLTRSTSITSTNDSSSSDDDSAARNTPGPSTRQTTVMEPTPPPTAQQTRATRRRAANAQSKESQKIRNRRGRRTENSGFRMLEAVAAALADGGVGGNRQILTNQQRSGLRYTKCSILESATRLLLICRPLLEQCREHDPDLARGLEEAVDVFMAEQVREEERREREEQQQQQQQTS